MLSKKLVQLLQTLSSKEFKKFEQYVSSPFFNRNSRLVTLVQCLRRAAPDFDSPSLEKEAIFRAMYGKEVEFNEQQVYDHISFLMRLLEDFLAFQQYEEDQGSRDAYLLRALTERKLDEHFSRSFRKARKRLNKDPFRNVAHQQKRFQLMQEATYQDAGQHKRKQDESLGETLKSLDLFFLTSKMRYTCELLNRQNIVNVSFSSEMIDRIVDFVEQPDNPYREEPAFSIYYQIYLMLTEFEQDQHYRKLVALLQKHSQLFPQDEAEGLYTYALNYCVKKSNTGRPEYIKELFSLYQQLLDKELLIVNEILDHRIYKNIVTAGLILKEYQWVGKFLDEYRKYISPEVQEAAYHYNLANYYYHQKAYRKALRTLQLLEIDDVYYHLSSKNLLLKTYFELEENPKLQTNIVQNVILQIGYQRVKCIHLCVFFA
jgi:hypothetical protein